MKYHYLGELQQRIIKELISPLTINQLALKIYGNLEKLNNLRFSLNNLIKKGIIEKRDKQYIKINDPNIAIIRETTQQSIVIPNHIRKKTKIGTKLKITNLLNNQSIIKVREKPSRIFLENKLKWKKGDKVKIEWIQN